MQITNHNRLAGFFLLKVLRLDICRVAALVSHPFAPVFRKLIRCDIADFLDRQISKTDYREGILRQIEILLLRNFLFSRFSIERFDTCHAPAAVGSESGHIPTWKYGFLAIARIVDGQLAVTLLRINGICRPFSVARKGVVGDRFPIVE